MKNFKSKAKHKKRKKSILENPDRISQLPDEILQEILSHLPINVAGTTSILSSRWKKVWKTIPGLNLHIHRCTNVKFLSFIDKTLAKYIKKTRYKCIPRFRLALDKCDYNLARYVDTLVQRLTRCDVKEFVFYQNDARGYYFPKDIFSLKSITVLHLTRCDLEQVSGRASNIELVSLRKLSLYSVVVCDLLIQRILATSLELEELTMDRCDGVTSIRIRDLVRLNMFRLNTNRNLRRVEIDAPSLERLFHREANHNPCEFKFTNCSNLKELIFGPPFETDEEMRERLSPLKNLKYLKLQGCDRLEFPKISSTSLTSLDLSFCDRLCKADIDTPNLKFLTLRGQLMSISLNAPPEIKVELYFSHFFFMGPNEFIDLIDLIGDFNGWDRVTLFLNIPNVNIPEEWKIHFDSSEYLCRCRNLWLGTNISIYKTIRILFPKLHIRYHESSLGESIICLSSDDVRGKKEKDEKVVTLTQMIKK